MDLNAIKWFAVLVAAGVTTAVAVEFITKRLQDYAVLAARSEVQKLILATQQANMNANMAQAAVRPPEVPPIKRDAASSFQGIMY
jgi:hypothetical protein